MKRMQRKLRKVVGRKWIGGVAAGFAYWFGFPTWVVRLVWAFSVLCLGTGVLFYILFWIFMPSWEETPSDYDQITGG